MIYLLLYARYICVCIYQSEKRNRKGQRPKPGTSGRSQAHLVALRHIWSLSSQNAGPCAYSCSGFQRPPVLGLLSANQKPCNVPPRDPARARDDPHPARRRRKKHDAHSMYLIRLTVVWMNMEAGLGAAKTDTSHYYNNSKAIQ